MSDYDKVLGTAGEIAKNKADTPRYSRATGHRVRNRYNYSSLDPIERRQQKYSGIAGGVAGAVAGARAAGAVGEHGTNKLNDTAAKLHEAKRINLKTRMTAHKVAPLLRHASKGEVIAGTAALTGLAGNSVGRSAMGAWQNRGSTTKKPVSKSQLPDGSYKPATKLSGKQRSAQRMAVAGGGKYGMGARKAVTVRRKNGTTFVEHFRTADSVRPKTPKTHYGTFRRKDESIKGRSLSAAFNQHGIQNRIADAHWDGEHARPSKVHPNISYGRTVGRNLETRFDQHIDPKLAGSLKHPVVIHHMSLGMPNVSAAATASHKTLLNGKGHVVIDHAVMDPDGLASGKYVNGITFDHLINHEISHASVHHKNPQRFASNMARSQGEEARADAVAVKGPGIYRRTGTIGNRASAASQRVAVEGLRRAGIMSEDKLPPGTTFKDVHESLKGHGHYNDVHRKVRIGRDGFKGYANDFKVGAKIAPEKYVAGAAVAGALAHHEWKKHHVNTADMALSKARESIAKATYVGANTRHQTTSGALAGGYLGAYGGAMAAQHPKAAKLGEKASDLRAAYHNNAHLRAQKAYGSYTSKETSPALRGGRGKWNLGGDGIRDVNDLSSRTQRVLRTGAKLKHVAATDKQFQTLATHAGLPLAGAVAGASAIGGLAHHAAAKRQAQFRG